MVGFNYRRVPALKLARDLVADGRIGELRHVRGAYLQDWLVDPAVPLAWRMRRELAGSGAIGDIGAHVIDLAQFLTGERLALSAHGQGPCYRTTASHRDVWRSGRHWRAGHRRGDRRRCFCPHGEVGQR